MLFMFDVEYSNELSKHALVHIPLICIMDALLYLRTVDCLEDNELRRCFHSGTGTYGVYAFIGINLHIHSCIASAVHIHVSRNTHNLSHSDTCNCTCAWRVLVYTLKLKPHMQTGF